MSTSSPPPGVIPDRIRATPAGCSRAMSYDTPPGTSMGTSQASTLAATWFVPAFRAYTAFMSSPFTFGACTMIAATWPSVSSLVICPAFTARLPAISTCWPSVVVPIAIVGARRNRKRDAQLVGLLREEPLVARRAIDELKILDGGEALL